MASFTNGKVFAGLLSITAADLDAITAQLLPAPGIISDRPNAGAVVDADTFLMLQASSSLLKSATALNVKSYLGAVYPPIGFNPTAPGVITTAGIVLPSPGPASQVLSSQTIGSVAGRQAWITLFLGCSAAAGATAINVAIYRQDNVACGLFTSGASAGFQLPAASTAGYVWPVSANWYDATTLAGNITYYALAQAVGGNITVPYCMLSVMLK